MDESFQPSPQQGQCDSGGANSIADGKLAEVCHHRTRSPSSLTEVQVGLGLVICLPPFGLGQYWARSRHSVNIC